MSATKPPQPPRFVVQCAKGKGWKTLVVEESPPAAERAFREVVKVNPKGYFRLIRLDYNPKADFEGMEFDWKLLQLHDPKKGAAAATALPAGKRGTRQGSGERVPIPVRLYGFALLLGSVLALAAILWLRSL
jgi:hypothetical protein